LVQFLARAPWMIERPTQPMPKTATVEPSEEMLVLVLWGAVTRYAPMPGVLMAAP
jgi:hypothetical protein